MAEKPGCLEQKAQRPLACPGATALWQHQSGLWSVLSCSCFLVTQNFSFIFSLKTASHQFLTPYTQLEDRGFLASF